MKDIRCLVSSMKSNNVPTPFWGEIITKRVFIDYQSILNVSCTQIENTVSKINLNVCKFTLIIS